MARAHLGLLGQGVHTQDVGARIWKKPGPQTTSWTWKYQLQIAYYPHPNFFCVTKFVFCLSQCLLFVCLFYVLKLNPNS